MKGNNQGIKSKGVYENSLNLNDFKAMYFNNQNIKAIKSNTKTNYKEGYVNIDTKEITLKYDAYTKREKIFNNNIWIDTKPLIINLFKDIILYIKKELIKYSLPKLNYILLDYKSIIYLYPPTTVPIIYIPKLRSLIIYVIYIMPINIVIYNNPKPKLSLIIYVIYIMPLNIVIYKIY